MWRRMRGREAVLCVLAASCLLLVELRARGTVVVEKWASSKRRQGDEGDVDSLAIGGGGGDGDDPRLSSSYPALQQEVRLRRRGEEHRVWQAHGVASHLFVLVGSYRVGARRFASVGLVAQHLQELGDPAFHCDWRPQGKNSTTIKGKAWKIRPDFGYHRLYGTLIISCSFDEDVVHDEGGSFWISVSYGDAFRPEERFIALTEAPGDYNVSAFQPPFPYEYVYCGSPLYGDVSPQRVREWMAHHNQFFGERAYFILYDGGGIHDEVYEVLKPWVKLGKVSIQNVREADMYDGYYHHQFAVVNDCMFRAQTMANWTFFFDLDEYLFVNSSVASLAQMLEDSHASQIQLQQIRLESGTCLLDPRFDNRSRDAANAKKWMMEKLVFSLQWRWPVIRDKKYAIRSRECWATGVHKCELLKDGGHTRVLDETQFRYYHFHNTMSTRAEVCHEFAPAHLAPDYLVKGEDNYSTDDTMVAMVQAVQQYELQTVGAQPFIL